MLFPLLEILDPSITRRLMTRDALIKSKSFKWLQSQEGYHSSNTSLHLSTNKALKQPWCQSEGENIFALMFFRWETGSEWNHSKRNKTLEKTHPRKFSSLHCLASKSVSLYSVGVGGEGDSKDPLLGKPFGTWAVSCVPLMDVYFCMFRTKRSPKYAHLVGYYEKNSFSNHWDYDFEI